MVATKRPGGTEGGDYGKRASTVELCLLGDP